MDGCGSPYLTYHHFDPPWAQQCHHNPKDILALCLQHHKEADAGAFTINQLRQLKGRSSKRPIQGRFHWRRERLFIIAGSNFFLGSPSILEYGERKLIWFGKNPDGYGTVNMDLFSPSGQLVFSMRNNDWVVLPAVDDVASPPSARRLAVRSKLHAVALDLEFRECSLSQVCARARRILEAAYSRADKRMPSIEGFTFPTREDPVENGVARVREYIVSKLNSDSISMCELNLEIRFPVPLKLSPTKLESRPGESLISLSGCLMGHVSVLKLNAQKGHERAYQSSQLDR